MQKFNGRTLAGGWALVSGGLILGIAGAVAQQPAGEGKQAQGKAKAPPLQRSPLFFREDWKPPTPAGERPLKLDDVSNPNLELKVYGPSGKDILFSGNAGSETNPLNLWTGVTTSPIAVGFREKNNFVDLTGSRQSSLGHAHFGFHAVRPTVKLADGTWLVGDRTSGTWADFNESDISYPEVLQWMVLDIERVVTERPLVENVDLSKVDEVGFADLMLRQRQWLIRRGAAAINVDAEWKCTGKRGKRPIGKRRQCSCGAGPWPAAVSQTAFASCRVARQRGSVAIPSELTFISTFPLEPAIPGQTLRSPAASPDSTKTG